MLSDLVKLVLAPISAENPSGNQLEDDPDLDKVTAEIQKIGSIHGGAVDWAGIVQAGKEILIRKSKDLTVASYLCMGLFHEQSYSGLSAGFEILVILLENFWETLYPPIKRMRGRVSAILWLSEKIEPEISKKEPVKDEAEAVQSCAVQFEKLDGLVRGKFGDNAPKLSTLKQAIQKHALKMKVQESLPGPKAEVKPVDQLLVAASPPASPAAVEFTSTSNAHQFILKAAAYLRETQPADPIPYRLTRIIRWQPVLRLPAANNGKTDLPGAIPQMVQGFQSLWNNAEWDKLLRQSESRFLDSLFWFDLQRFIDRSMTELGEAYKNARQVVREELAALVRRLPGILDLQFKNGIPYADAQTKLWIDAEVMPSVSSDTSATVEVKAANPAAKSDGDDLEKTVAEARILAAGGKIQDAVSLLKEKLMAAPLRREQFIWKLNLAKLCLEAGYPRLALPLLESLDNEVRQFSLEQWEPNLSIEVVRALLQCKRKVMQDTKRPQTEIAEQTGELYARLCQLDILTALTLDTNS